MPAHDESTLTCAAAEPLLEAYVDGELDGERRHRLELHLASCGACGAELRLARRIRGELRRLPQLSCPGHLIHVARARTAPRPPLTQRLVAWLRPRWQPAFALLLVAALTAGLWYAVDYRRREAEVARAEAEVKLALAYLGRINRRTGVAVGDEVLEKRVLAPIGRTITGAVFGRPEKTNGGNADAH